MRYGRIWTATQVTAMMADITDKIDMHLPANPAAGAPAPAASRQCTVPQSPAPGRFR
jgi:hypothetical protein